MTTFRPVKEFHREYEMGDELGTGNFGTIRRCTHRATGKEFACKRVAGQPESLRAAANEIRALSIVRGSENVVSFHAVFRNPKTSTLYMVMDLATNGDLLSRVQERGGLPEWEARNLFLGVARGVKECHDRDVMHRDIKPDNVLLFPRSTDDQETSSGPKPALPKNPQSSSCNHPGASQLRIHDSSSFNDFAGRSNPPSPTGPLSPNIPPSPRRPGQDRFVLSQDNVPRETKIVAKLADLGSSVVVKQWQRTQGFVGSLPYAAPEVLAGNDYSFPADVWSLGATLFAMLSCRWPTVINGRQASKDWEMPCWTSVSNRAKNLIARMLSRDPDRRPTIDQVLADRWLSSCSARGLPFREETWLAAMALRVTRATSSASSSSTQSQGTSGAGAVKIVQATSRSSSTLVSRLLPRRWLRMHEFQ